MKLYVGLGLTQAPESFRNDFQHELKASLRQIEGLQILDFIGLENGTEVDVYNHDRSCTESADLCVFVADHPSIRLGIEIAFRLLSGKPMLIFAHHHAKVTRMLTGMCEKEKIPFHRYGCVEDINLQVKMKLARI